MLSHDLPEHRRCCNRAATVYFAPHLSGHHHHPRVSRVLRGRSVRKQPLPLLGASIGRSRRRQQQPR